VTPSEPDVAPPVETVNPEAPVVIPLGGDTATSFATRGRLVQLAFGFAREHPVMGAGFGVSRLYVERLAGAQIDIHNMAMTILAETGFVGAALFVWCLGWGVWAACLAYVRAAGDPLRPLRAGLLVALLSFLVMTLSFDGQRQRGLWLLLAVVCASTRPGAFGAIGGETVPASATEPDRA
jgi:O-antigen ligase